MFEDLEEIQKVFGKYVVFNSTIVKRKSTKNEASEFVGSIRNHWSRTSIRLVFLARFAGQGRLEDILEGIHRHGGDPPRSDRFFTNI